MSTKFYIPGTYLSIFRVKLSHFHGKRGRKSGSLFRGENFSLFGAIEFLEEKQTMNLILCNCIKTAFNLNGDRIFFPK